MHGGAGDTTVMPVSCTVWLFLPRPARQAHLPLVQLLALTDFCPLCPAWTLSTHCTPSLSAAATTCTTSEAIS